MSMDSISLNNNAITALTQDHDAVVTKKQLTSAMIESFLQKEAGQALKAKIEQVEMELSEAWQMHQGAFLVYFRPAVTRLEQRKYDVIDNELAVKLSEYMTKTGLPNKGGAHPTLREWLYNANEIDKYVTEVLFPKIEELNRETIKAVAEYETALRLANIKGVLFDASAS